MRKTPRVPAFAVSLGLLVCVAARALAGDWPTYRHDGRRSGITAEEIKTPLSQEWLFTATHGPEHAWGDPQPKPIEHVLELPRMRFDDAFHVVAAGGTVYFGSSSDGKVYALDAASGKVRWEFFTGGPVRLAPTVANGKLYVGSDDGWVYCLGAGDGRLVWRFRAAPSDRKLLGNGKMISVWPVRTGVLVDSGVAYFGAGVFPAEGLYLYAVDAQTGKLLWKNDTYGAGGMAGISPQGHLVASKDRLFAPASRTMPAGFDRKTGRFLFQRNLSWRLTGLFGGTSCQLAGDALFGGTEQLVAMRERDGRLALTEGLPAGRPSTGVRRLVVADDTLYLLNGKELLAADRDGWLTAKTKLTSLTVERSSLGRRQRSFTMAEARLKAEQAKLKKAGRPVPKKLAEALDAARGQLAQVRKRLSQAGVEAKEWKAKEPAATRWRAPCEGSDALILAGGTVFAGAGDVVRAFGAADGKQVWSAKVAGRARSLAVADGRLLVSTDKGSIHCFVPGDGGRGSTVTPKVVAEPFGKDERVRQCAALARRIVADSGVRRGYALVLGGGDGRLALELARRTELVVYVAEPDAKKVAAARAALSRAGVYGKKVVVLHTPGPGLPLPDYFANLVVCDATFFAGKMPSGEEVARLVKPCGGVGYAIAPGQDRQGDYEDWTDRASDAFGATDAGDTQLIETERYGKVVRGSLPGAGRWTHEYAEPGNTACGDDRLVRGPLGVLWYGRPGPERMPSRHASAAAPVAVGGRMFVQGENVVMAYDVYNGLKLWQREIAGAMRLGLKARSSNLAADDASLFVAVADRCLRLDAATGKTLETHKVPPPGKGRKGGNWDYVAVVGSRLYGSRGSGCVFAVDLDTGKRLWVHEGGTIEARTICIGDGRVFFVDRRVTAKQRAEAVKGIAPQQRLDRRGKPIPPDVRLIVGLDAETGKVAWSRPQYVADCVKIGRSGGELTVMYANKVLLLCGQPWNGHFWREFMAREFSRRSLIALSYDGEPLWSGRKGYRSRPIIVGGRIIAEPWAHDLRTGTEITRVHPVTGRKDAWQMSRPGHHCGNIAACANVLFFRSGVTAYYDLLADHGTAHFGGHRPGCWINCIPACGLVIMPEASSGCICPFALQCTAVFQPRKEPRMWGMYSAPGAMRPVKRLAVNFGAPGDRRDADGTLWLGYPRPRSYEQDYNQRLVLNFKLGFEGDPDEIVAHRGNAYFAKIAGARDPWLYTHACTGLAGCTIPLIEKGTEPATYTVRLHFAEVQNAPPGGRVFDVTLQGRRVLAKLDVAKEAGGPNRAVVKEFKGVRVKDDLRIGMKAHRGHPMLAAVEVIREEK